MAAGLFISWGALSHRGVPRASIYEIEMEMPRTEVERILGKPSGEGEPWPDDVVRMLEWQIDGGPFRCGTLALGFDAEDKVTARFVVLPEDMESWVDSMRAWLGL